ncbi:MAG TPA: hypothetical protein VK932_12195 [Kofleriaceae bacterium]|nr:hypothetical protein [Kofleriaceae bacterium]
MLATIKAVPCYAQLAVHKSRSLREYPQGPRREMSDEWKAAVEAALASHVPPMTRSELARELGVTRGLITKLLKPIAEGGQQVSALVPRICAVLNVPMPHESVADTLPSAVPSAPVPEMVYLFERLDAQGRARVLETARRELDRILGAATGKIPKPSR